MKITCPHCGSDNIGKDAVASWNPEANEWELAGVHDCETCGDCGRDGDFMGVRDHGDDDRRMVEALRPLADRAGIVSDSFKVGAALEAAGFTRADFRDAWLDRNVVTLAPSLPGTFGHTRFQLPVEA